MTLAELRALDVTVLWAALTPDQQEQIGIAAIAQELAQLVAASESVEANPQERREAAEMAGEADDGLSKAIEAALPGVAWWPA